MAGYIHRHYKDNIEKLCIVLPNKRGALFLKKHLAAVYGKTIWLPRMISAEDLVAELSGLKTLDELDLICHLYESYKQCFGQKAESFESFARWGQLILQDFNEIDRYLADSEKLYENLRNIKEIENWSLGEENLSPFQMDYLEFMSSLGQIYKHYASFLIQKGWAYQGLAYREAVNHLHKKDFAAPYHKIIFCGFNALNNAELKIFGHFYKNGQADMLWDADEYYLNNVHHEAGFFLRKSFGIFHPKDPQFIENNFTADKKIEIISAPKQIGQAQVVKQCVQNFISRNIPLDKVAIVLANEKLLWPVLKQLPEEVPWVNITMEYPLRYTSTYALMDAILQIQLNYARQNRQQKHIYFRDLLALLSQPLFNSWLLANSSKLNSGRISEEINRRNLSFISEKHFHSLFTDDTVIVKNLLAESHNMQALNEVLLQLLLKIQAYFASQEPGNEISLELEYLEIFIRQLRRLEEILRQYPHFSDIRAYKQIFSQVVANSSAPFIGEPLRGLQVMGVLETRTLDFEYLVLVNVNESVLPSGKSQNSFIPNDLKRAFDLPLYTEKDAIYSYHFYRLLQRAKEITITFDSETDTFGKGEKSRFITQLQLEMPDYSKSIHITEYAASPGAMSGEAEPALSFPKNDQTLENIRKRAVREDGGLSPSSLMIYKDCPLKFYLRYEAGLKEIKMVEESAEAGTFGTILHESLEDLYSKFKGREVNGIEFSLEMKRIEEAVRQAFKEHFEGESIAGKSLLQFEVIKAYAEKLMRSDLQLIQRLNEQTENIKILELEKEFKTSLQIESDHVPYLVYIGGKIDRIDELKGKTRIIDYKSSVKRDDHFEFNGFEELFTNKKYDKQFQLIMYCWLLYKNNFCQPEQMQPGIIPFKEFSAEPKFLIDQNKDLLKFSRSFLDEFETHLKIFVERIFDQSSVFDQTREEELCVYCDFKLICRR